MHYVTHTLPPQDIYRLLTSSVVPRPIAWVSTRSSTGVDNLAPFSFFTIASVQPPVLAIVQLRPPHRPAKDTLVNLRATRECVVNIATSDLLDAMNATAADYPPDISEFDMAQIERCASQWVGVPGVKQACVRHECRLRDVLELGNNPMGGTLILLDVVEAASTNLCCKTAPWFRHGWTPWASSVPTGTAIPASNANANGLPSALWATATANLDDGSQGWSIPAVDAAAAAAAAEAAVTIWLAAAADADAVCCWLRTNKLVMSCTAAGGT